MANAAKRAAMKPTTKKPAKKAAKKPARKAAAKPMKKAKKAKKAKKIDTRSLAERVAALADATDYASLHKALRSIGDIATPEAHATLLNLAMNPPKHPAQEDLVINAMEFLDRAIKEHRAVHEMLLDTCETKPDHPRVCEALIILGNAANADSLKDRRLYALLCKALSDPNLVEAQGQAIYVLTKHKDAESLPLMVAALDRLGPADGHTVGLIAQCMYDLRQVDADGLAKVHAARSRLITDSLPSYVERTIERLADMV